MVTVPKKGMIPRTPTAAAVFLKLPVTSITTAQFNATVAVSVPV